MAPKTTSTTKATPKTTKASSAKEPAAPRKPQESTAVVRETKTERHARATAAWTAVQAGQGAVSGGMLAGLPSLPDGDVWLDITWVSVIIGGTAETTINYWVSLGKPVHNPFPRPHQYLRINLWKLSEVLAWTQVDRA